ncbi:MAG: hypothetical protein KA818_10540 [Methanoculleus sp.]|nr:hypothetical protein [Methanoculleus sp.]
MLTAGETAIALVRRRFRVLTAGGEMGRTWRSFATTTDARESAHIF